jgi:hypothetical protein
MMLEDLKFKPELGMCSPSLPPFASLPLTPFPTSPTPHHPSFASPSLTPLITTNHPRTNYHSLTLLSTTFLHPHPQNLEPPRLQIPRLPARAPPRDLPPLFKEIHLTQPIRPRRLPPLVPKPPSPLFGRQQDPRRFQYNPRRFPGAAKDGIPSHHRKSRRI